MIKIYALFVSLIFCMIPLNLTAAAPAVNKPQGQIAQMVCDAAGLIVLNTPKQSADPYSFRRVNPEEKFATSKQALLAFIKKFLEQSKTIDADTLSASKDALNAACGQLGDELSQIQIVFTQPFGRIPNPFHCLQYISRVSSVRIESLPVEKNDLVQLLQTKTLVSLEFDQCGKIYLPAMKDLDSLQIVGCALADDSFSSFSKLATLKLENNTGVFTLPDLSHSGITSLTVKNCSGIALKSNQLAVIRSLLDIDLSNNNLTDLPTILPAKWDRTKGVANASVYLSHNKLPQNVITTLLMSKKLDNLYLSYNELTDFPRVEKSSIKALDLEGNHLSPEALKNVCALENLEWLNLSMDTVKELPQEIGKLEYLQTITLKENSIPEKQIKELRDRNVAVVFKG